MYKLGYQESTYRNVGDDLNKWLMAKILPDIEFGNNDKVLLCVGSILVSGKWDNYKTKLVVGSGAKSLARLPALDDSWNIRFTRGPRTAAALNATWISDPALLVSQYMRSGQTRKGIGIVPYYRSDHRSWEGIADRIGARLISPTLDVENFVAALTSCERVFCEAMHGAILADAFRIPWRPITFLNQIFEGDTHFFKWTDWTESMDLAFDPLVQSADHAKRQNGGGALARMRASVVGAKCCRTLAALMRSGLRDDQFTLSKNDVFEDRVGRMSDVFRDLNACR